MKILISIIAVLLVGAIGFAGYTLYRQSAQPPAPASSSTAPTKLSVGEIKGPDTQYKVPEALASAIQHNKDTVAWLQIPDTDINNSVVQANDNVYYERRNEAQEHEVYGCFFADYECPVGARDTLLPNTIIYGHSSPGDDPNGKRFSQLFRFTDIEFAKVHPCIYLTTPEERLTFEIFSIFYTDIGFDYIKANITGEEMLEISSKGTELSIYTYPYTPTADDRVLTLSTCTEKFGTDGNHRFVLQARLLPEGAPEPTAVELTAKQ